MSEEMPVLQATRRAMKELVDGTLRVQIDIEPKFKQRFMELFGQIDMPLAVAPLGGLVQCSERESGWSKLGPLAQSAIQLCKEPKFQTYVGEMEGVDAQQSEDSCAAYIKTYCRVGSRRDLDTADGARERFGSLMSHYREWARG